MGLLDILNGMQNGPRGAPQPAPAGKSGGMSPLMMALLGMLAYKAIKGGGLENMLRGNSGASAPAPAPQSTPQSGGLGDILGGMLGGGGARPGVAPGGGGLGDVLGGMFGAGARPGGAAPGGLGDILGGLLGGAAAGGVLNGGLRNLLQDMSENGQGDAVKSWIGTGENKSVSPNDLAQAIGVDDIDAVAHQTGMNRDQVLSALSQHLPELVDQLTPQGRLPTDQEASHW